MGRLIWLASYPKSGNTWLRAFLHNACFDGATPHDINRLSDLTLGEAMTKWYARHDPRPLGQLSHAELMALRPKAHRDMAALRPEDVFVKTHNARVSYQGVPVLTPELTAGAIYVVRDPRDVALSFADHHGWTIDRTIKAMAADMVKPTTSDTVLEVYGSWSGHVLSWTGRPLPGVLAVRYEDMESTPEATFGRVLRFLGLPFDEARIGRAVAAASFAALQAQEAAAGFGERSRHSARFFRVGRSGQWREQLTRPQVAAIEQAHGVQMARFGYRPAG